MSQNQFVIDRFYQNNKKNIDISQNIQNNLIKYNSNTLLINNNNQYKLKYNLSTINTLKDKTNLNLITNDYISVSSKHINNYTGNNTYNYNELKDNTNNINDNYSLLNLSLRNKIISTEKSTASNSLIYKSGNSKYYYNMNNNNSVNDLNLKKDNFNFNTSSSMNSAFLRKNNKSTFENNIFFNNDCKNIDYNKDYHKDSKFNFINSCKNSDNANSLIGLKNNDLSCNNTIIKSINNNINTEFNLDLSSLKHIDYKNDKNDLSITSENKLIKENHNLNLLCCDYSNNNSVNNYNSLSVSNDYLSVDDLVFNNDNSKLIDNITSSINNNLNLSENNNNSNKELKCVNNNNNINPEDYNSYLVMNNEHEYKSKKLKSKNLTNIKNINKEYNNLSSMPKNKRIRHIADFVNSNYSINFYNNICIESNNSKSLNICNFKDDISIKLIEITKLLLKLIYNEVVSIKKSLEYKQLLPQNNLVNRSSVIIKPDLLMYMDSEEIQIIELFYMKLFYNFNEFIKQYNKKDIFEHLIKFINIERQQDLWNSYFKENLQYLCNNELSNYYIQILIFEISNNVHYQYIRFNEIIIYADSLCYNKYGTHVIQKMLICFEDSIIKDLIKFIFINFDCLSKNQYGVIIIKKLIYKLSKQTNDINFPNNFYNNNNNNNNNKITLQKNNLSIQAYSFLNYVYEKLDVLLNNKYSVYVVISLFDYFSVENCLNIVNYLGKSFFKYVVELNCSRLIHIILESNINIVR